MSIRLESVNMVSMGESIISDVSLTVERGTMNVLLGPTLAGKTTLMRLMAGLDKPTSGRILVDGKDVTGVSVRERSVAMVYQEFVNYPSFTVYENIAAPLRRAKRLSRNEIDQASEQQRDAAYQSSAAPPAVGAFRRAAATRRHRPRDGEGSADLAAR